MSARPAEVELKALYAAVPDQPRRVAVVLAGQRELPGWYGGGRDADWTDALDAALLVVRTLGLESAPRADVHAPWHPGRCARIEVNGTLVGHAGELHPNVVAALGLPERTVAAELDLERLIAMSRGIRRGRPVSTFPVAKEDVALVVEAGVTAGAVEAALRAGAGELLESVRLFDVYTGPQVGAGPQVAGLRAAAAGARPDADRPRGGCRPRRRAAGCWRAHRGGVARLMDASSAAGPQPGPARVALVTGAARGLGRELALGLAAAGLRVGLLGRSRPGLEQVAGEVHEGGGEAAVVIADVRSYPEVVAAVDEVERRLGGIDLLVNNAGVIEAAEEPVWLADPDAWWQVVETDLRGPFHCVRAVVPGMLARGGGRVVDLNSGAGSDDRPVYSAYSAAKAGLFRVGGSLHEAGFARGMRAFEISPGVVRTDMTAAMALHAGRTAWTPPEALVALVLAVAAGRLDRWSGCFLRAGLDTPEALEAVAGGAVAGVTGATAAAGVTGATAAAGVTGATAAAGVAARVAPGAMTPGARARRLRVHPYGPADPLA